MLFSIALIVFLSLVLVSVFQKIKIPGTIAMILTGIILGPFVLNLISPDILSVSADLRKIALVVILLRAGLSLNLHDLKKVKKTTILMSFLPSTLEIIIFTLLAPWLFHISLIEAMIMGSIVAAVSPAIVVPKMLHMIEKQEGTEKKLPQMILASASLDDIYVIIVFSIFIQIYLQGSFEIAFLYTLPLSIILGLIAGLLLGWGLVLLFKKWHIRDTIKVFIILSIAFMLLYLEDILKNIIAFSSLLSIMTLGITILMKYPVLANRLTIKFSKVWVGAEIMLFVLVGAIVDISILPQVGLIAIAIVLISLCARMLGVYISTCKSAFQKQEKWFIAASFIPKATVQAAIGAIPLSMGLASGNIILAIAVLSILISAPIGTILMDYLSKRQYHDALEISNEPLS